MNHVIGKILNVVFSKFWMLIGVCLVASSMATAKEAFGIMFLCWTFITLGSLLLDKHREEKEQQAMKVDDKRVGKTTYERRGA